MQILENYHNTSTIFTVFEVVRVSHENFELGLRDLKLYRSIDLLNRSIILHFRCLVVYTLVISAGNNEVS